MLRLGIIGFSDGNGHPYSWSAIFNGYNPELMKNSDFPNIYEYLSRQRFPDDFLTGIARVTHIWTQDRSLSEYIACAVNIENIVDHYTEMIGKVDAILLARDDYERHYEISEPFLKAGLPIYIDKPIAVDVKTAEEIFSLEKYDGQIFTCSALSFACELQIDNEDRKQLGKIKYIDACVAKSWDRYGIHIVEPVLKIIGSEVEIKNIYSISHDGMDIVIIDWDDGLRSVFNTLGHIGCPITVRIFGDKGFKFIEFKDTFAAFKRTLKTFIDVVLGKSKPPSKKFVLKAVHIIEMGLKLKYDSERWIGVKK
jgi:hypothetical protein